MRIRNLLFISILLSLFAQRATAQSYLDVNISVQRLSDRVLVLTEDSPMENNIVALASEKGLVVVDTSGSTITARAMRARIAKEFGRKDFAYTINTHYHWDHARGNQVFADTTLIGHENCIPQMRQDRANAPARFPRREQFLKEREAQIAALPADSEEARALRRSQDFAMRNFMSETDGFELTVPSLVFKDRMTLDLGDMTLNLLFFGSAHSGSDILIHVPEEGLLLTGDLFLDKGWLPLFAGMRNLEVPRFIETLGQVLDSDDSVRIVIPGHRHLWTRDTLILWRDYIVKHWEGIKAADKEGLDLNAIYARFPLAEEYYYLRDLDHIDGEIKRFHENTLLAFWRQLKGTAADMVETCLCEEGAEAAKEKFAALRSSRSRGIIFDESDFNNLGYKLMGAGDLKGAIVIFELNAEAFPASWNVHDSLGEALLKAGQTREAMVSYEKSIELNPQNENGKAVVEQLKRGG